MLKSKAVRLGLSLSVCLASVQGFAAGPAFGVGAKFNSAVVSSQSNLTQKKQSNTDLFSVVNSAKLSVVVKSVVPSNAPKSAQDCFKQFDSQQSTYNSCITIATAPANSPAGKLKAAKEKDDKDTLGLGDEVLKVCQSFGYNDKKLCGIKFPEEQQKYCGFDALKAKNVSCTAQLGQEKDAKDALCAADQKSKTDWMVLVATGINTLSDDDVKIAAAQKVLDGLKSDKVTHQIVLKNRQAEVQKAIDKKAADGCK